jgi:hypothetical protein
VPCCCVAGDVLSAVDRMAKRLKGELRRNAKKQGEPAEINDHGVRQLLRSGSVACRLLTQTWLVDALDRAQAPLPEIRNADGEEIVFSQVRFPIVGDVAKIAAILDGIDRFERDDAGELRWSWHGPGSPSQRMSRKRQEGLTFGSADEGGRTSLGSAESSAVNEPGAAAARVFCQISAKDSANHSGGFGSGGKTGAAPYSPWCSYAALGPIRRASSAL